MTMMTKFLGAAAVLALSAGAALADPAIIFDLGGKFDKSFNEAAFHGAEKWANETGGKFAEIELQLGSPARAGAAPLRRGRQQPDRDDRLRLRLGAGHRGAGLPGHQVRDHRHGRGPAERPLGGVQRA